VNAVSLPNVEKVVRIATGANHSVVLEESGTAYTFGADDVVPNVGHDGEEEEGIPIRAPQASANSAGYAHAVLSTISGKVYVFGQSDNGQLGLGIEHEQELIRNPVPVTPVIHVA